MKRRRFGLLTGTSLLALNFREARAQAAPDAALLKTTLTPFGAERAGNAAGTIPAWTGGLTTVPDGWQPGQYMPDPYASDAVLVTIDSSNMAQYAAQLSDGVKTMMTKYGLSIRVQPSHRSAAAPQWVYDNIAANIATAKLNPDGGRLGFTGGFGGIPFPIPDAQDPYAAGAQIMWNHYVRWAGYGEASMLWAYAVQHGIVALAEKSPCQYDYPYYRKGGSLTSYDGQSYRELTTYLGPANDVGSELIAINMSNPYEVQNEVWELLNGQGRVRKAPEVAYDTPSSQTDGVANYDEYFGVAGALDRYDWKCLGKTELYIPYNNNTMFGQPGAPSHLAHFIDPAIVRWELHRVWVIEASVHPGKRNVLSRRRIYVDEDTWTVCMTDCYDSSNNLYHLGLVYFYTRPDLPGVVMGCNSVHNLQTGDFATMAGNWDEKAHPTVRFTDGFPNSLFDPQNMASAAQY